MDNIKQRLRTEPTRTRRPNSLIRIRCILLVDFDRCATTPSRSGISHQLRMAALLQADEPEDCSFDRLSDREEAVVLQQRGLLVSKRRGDMLPFCFGEDDTVELLVDNMVLQSLLVPNSNCSFLGAGAGEIQ